MATTEGPWRVVVGLSLALLFFSVPHVLEDFALGEPLRRGAPAPLIAAVVSSLLALQGLGLYWIGRRRVRGLWLHAALGGLWALAAGAAQLPEIFAAGPYRAGFVSLAYVAGVIGLGVALLAASLLAVRSSARSFGAPVRPP